MVLNRIIDQHRHQTKNSITVIMIIPIRCFSCGKVTGNMWDSYKNLLQKGVPPAKALTDVGCIRFCCRRMLVSHVELIDAQLDLNEANETRTYME
jgi:DNA-directed RNA polymerase I, II, and III subunit RPABC5